MRSLAARLRSEDGVALAIAMLTMMIIGTLSAILLASATESSQTSVNDRNGKAALAVANAGLQLAVYRLDNTSAQAGSDNDCFTTGWVAPAGGSCPGRQESYGSGPIGGTFTYYVTPVLASSNAVPFQPGDCTGYPVVSSGQAVVQRCITVIGDVDGVQRRVQERVVGYRGASKFPLNGIVSLGAMSFTNTLQMTGDLGANGNISFTNTASVSGTVTYVPPSTISGNPCTPCSRVSQAQPFQSPPPDDNAYATALATNADNSIVWPASSGCTVVTYLVKCTAVVGSPTSPIVFQPGTYYYCGWNFTNKLYIATSASVTASNPVRIYIDSPNRPQSPCLSGTGYVDITNSMSFVNSAKDPTAFEIDAYGNPSGGTLTPFEFTNSLDSASNPFYGNIYAPYSAWSTTNTAYLNGSIVAGSFKATNQVVFNAAGGGGGGTNGAVAHFGAAYAQCPTRYSGDPGSGCY